MLDLITKIFSDNSKKIILGRWTINYYPISINKKIDSGNTDHCGTCHFENLQKKYDDEDDNNDKSLK